MKKRSVRNSAVIIDDIKIEAEEIDKSEDTQYFPEFELPIERPKYICSVCQNEKSFSDKNCLKKHIKKIHQLEPEPLLQSNFESNKTNIFIFSFTCNMIIPTRQ